MTLKEAIEIAKDIVISLENHKRGLNEKADYADFIRFKVRLEAMDTLIDAVNGDKCDCTHIEENGAGTDPNCVKHGVYGTEYKPKDKPVEKLRGFGICGTCGEYFNEELNRKPHKCVDKPSEGLEAMLREYLVKDYVVTEEDAKDLAIEIKKWVEGRIDELELDEHFGDKANWERNEAWNNALAEVRKALLGEV